MLRLCKCPLQSTLYEDILKIAKSYRIEDNIDLYTDKTAVKEFLYLWKEGFLPKGQTFSIFCKTPQKQAIALCNLLYYAKDWDTFYRTACWARENINEMMFLYALQTAIFHRPDTEDLILPPLYEIYPYFFVNSEVMDKACEYKMKYCGLQKTTERKTYSIPAEYSGMLINTNPEQKDLAYFTEDLALNLYYTYYNIEYPFWMGGDEFSLEKDRRGELFYWIHQQLLARYYMERLCNNYGSIPLFEWREPLKTGYVPFMRLHTGLEFSTRPAYASLMYNPHNQPHTTTLEDNMFDIMEIEDYERRIRDAIDSGYILTEDGTKINLYEPDGFDLLGKLIEGSPDSPNTRFYGPLMMMAHQILGYAGRTMDEYKIVPSAMEYFVTALRDPVFYQLYKKILYFFLKYKKNLPSYTYTELNCPSLKIENITMDKLITYFDHFDFEITNGLYFTEEELEKDNFHVLARTLRLNHKPFSYKITVNCEKKMNAIVRVFLGPKCDEQDNLLLLDDNRINFVELDKFVQTLTTGKNIIERRCEQTDMIKDRMSYRALCHHVMSALKGQEEFRLDLTEMRSGFPLRFMLPKGKVEGQEFLLYVYVCPYKPLTTKLTSDRRVLGSGTRYMDSLPLGFPLDRPIEDEKMFMVSNSYMKEIMIYHKTDEEMTTTHM